MPQPSPAVLQLIDWLQGHVPAEDAAPPAPALVHGDYRLDNLVFDEQLQVSESHTLMQSLKTLLLAWGARPCSCLCG